MSIAPTRCRPDTDLAKQLGEFYDSGSRQYTQQPSNNQITDIAGAFQAHS